MLWTASEYVQRLRMRVVLAMQLGLLFVGVHDAGFGVMGSASIYNTSAWSALC